MPEDESVFWADRVTQELIKRKKKSYVCEGMWTPSGHFHIGNARPEIFVPYLVRRVLEERGFKAKQNFITDDFDGIRKIPPSLDIPKKDESKYLGKPCALAPSPTPGYDNWADGFVSRIRESLPKFDIKLNIVSAYETYKSGALNEIIKQVLDSHEKIVGVWNRVAGTDKPKDFLPIQMLCEKCSKILSTTAAGWNGKEVSYTCECGHSASASPLNGKAKLHWRVHWVAHWILNGVDFESAGKDHFSKGGSIDVGNALMREVFAAEPPYQIPTEFINLKGAKMAGSVGNVITLNDWLTIAPAEAFRFMNLMYRPGKAIDFDLTGNSLPLLMERFERAERIFYGKEEAETEKRGETIKRAYKLSKISDLPKQPPTQIPYSLAVLIAQLVDPKKEPKRALQMVCEAKQCSRVPKAQSKELLAKLARARSWSEKYAPEEMKIRFAEKPPKEIQTRLSPKTRGAIKTIAAALPKLKTPQEIQQLIFDAAHKQEIQPKDLFGALYLALLARERGPKIGTLIIALGKEKVINRLKELC